MARVPVEATAFAHRLNPILVNVAAVYESPDQAEIHEPWVADFASSLGGGETGAYVGFVSDEAEGRIRQAYPGPTWERLREVKARYDPSNLFHFNQNIPPR